MNTQKITRSALLFSLLIAVNAAAQEKRVVSLDECRSLALEHNIIMRTADINYQQAVEQKRETFTNFFPTIEASGGAYTINKYAVDTNIMGMPLQYVKSGSFALVEAMQPVFAGGRIVNGNKLAKVGVEVSRIRREQSADEVAITAEQQYWQVVILQEKLHTIDAVDTMLRQMNGDVSTAVAAGVKMRNDLLQVQLKQNETEANRLTVENALNVSKMLLAQYIGLDNVEVSSDIDFSLLPAFPLNLKKEHESVLAGTPEYRLLEKNVEAKKLDRRIEIGKHMPSVAVGAGIASHNIIDGRQNLASVFATLTVPLSDWWGGSHAMRRMKLSEDIARQELEDNSQLLLIRMQNEWNGVEEAYKQLAIAGKSIGQTEENLRINTDSYRAGTIPLSELLTAQQQFQQARDKYVEAYADYNIKISQYRQATFSHEE